MLEYIRTIMEVRGLPSSFVEKVVKTSGEWFISVKGRFYQAIKKERIVPLSLLFEQPSISDVCTFMIRDIIADPNDFVKWMNKLGVYRDVALFYYLLHYRYPSPERLSEFVWRGIAGELWYPEAKVDENVLRVFGIAPESVSAKAPRELNFQGKDLFSMLSTYMKWHDYARFPWNPGWPTDNSIIIDLLADIPGKIDLRWMSRWGIFDYWSAKGIGLKTSIEEITKNLLPPKGSVQARDVYQYFKKQLSAQAPVFDVRQFARTLQATGLHPYWIPWISIAESINALTEERTLLRTGFMNLYEEGLLDLNGLNDLLAGFFSIKFITGYYDMESHDWTDVTVEVPVAFLPAESKLMELRSIFDRAVSLIRDYISVLRTGVREWFISPSEAISKLQSFVALINKQWFTNAVQKVTGKSLSLTLDKAFSETLEKYFEDVADLSTTKLEVIPTPSQVASFSEYINVPDDVIKEVLSVRRIPDKYKKLWVNYIRTRMISSEVNQLVSDIRRLYEYFTVPNQLLKEVKDLMSRGGWTSAELPIFDKDLEVRKLYRIMSYLIPTIRGAVGDAYYLPDEEKLIEEVVKARGIDTQKYKKQIDYYKRLAKNRKIYRRLSSFITELINDYASRVIEMNELKKELEGLKPYGIIDEEINIIIKIAEYRRRRYDKIYGQGG
ncbi:MAG: hypothetical protein DRO12_03560 [Thermoprotei archaeon]|nr:MAG: hypothetical protein DRO12_03560 [Thermoprotei archaeon]